MLRLNLDSSLKTTWFHSAAVQVPRERHHSKWIRRWVGVKGSTRKGHHAPKCPSAKGLRMVREDPREGVTCAWMAADETVGCTCAFFTISRCFQGLVCPQCAEPGLRLNDFSRTHWSKHLLTTQSERPN
ncbi:uncharacterized protein TNCV_3225301 [Trichonephila clavipes]|nr:uncharacterized protein TNCV_3225301 [Trichonephila clavipes]